MRTFVAPLLKRNGAPIQTPSDNMGSGTPICWLDRLLVGELQEAPQLRRPLVILLSGPPGAGKSMLTQQICYEVAYHRCRTFAGNDDPVQASREASSLIITSETTPIALVKNLDALGYMQCPKASNPVFAADKAQTAGLYVFDTLPDQLRQLAKEQNQLAPLVPDGPGLTPLMLVSEGPKSSETSMAQTMDGSQKQSKEQIEQIAKGIEDSWSEAKSKFQEVSEFPKILVIDSLNVLSRRATDRGMLFDCLVNLFTSGPAFLFLVLDTPGPGPSQDVSGHEYWEYMADVSIRVDYGYVGEERYFARHLEIVKARLQEHTLGKQSAKIYDKPTYRQRNEGVDLTIDPEGARPYLFRGGLFVFPSLHYVLSRSRTRTKLVGTNPIRPKLKWAAQPRYAPGAAPEAEQWAKWGPGDIAPPIETNASKQLVNWDVNAEPPPTLNWPDPGCFELVGGGIPLNRTVATVGPRGGRTSYFAYRFLLDGVARGEQTLLLSFMEPPEAARTTLRELAKAPQYRNQQNKPLAIQDDNPIIVYQRPGYVMPEEWFHRIIAAVGEYSPIRVALVAVDQWESGHPLLGNSRILLPTLIDFLGAHEVTSVIAGIDLDRRTLRRCGLTAKAAITLSFDHRRIPWTDDQPRPTRPSKGAGIDWFAEGVQLAEPPDEKTPKRTKLVVRATRVGRGAPGFGRAVLEFVPDGPAAGSEMILLAPEFDEGTPI